MVVAMRFWVEISTPIPPCLLSLCLPAHTSQLCFINNLLRKQHDFCELQNLICHCVVFSRFYCFCICCCYLLECSKMAMLFVLLQSNFLFIADDLLGHHPGHIRLGDLVLSKSQLSKILMHLYMFLLCFFIQFKKADFVYWRQK